MVATLSRKTALIAGDLVVTRQPVVYVAERDNGRGPRHDDIPAGTLGMVQARVQNRPVVFVDFGDWQCFVPEKFLSAVDVENGAALEDQFDLGTNLLNFISDQRLIILDLQAQINSQSVRFAHMGQTFEAARRRLEGDLAASAAALEASQDQVRGLQDAIAEMEHLEQARLMTHQQVLMAWIETPVDVAMGPYGWVFGGEVRNPDTGVVTSWRWYRDCLSEDSSLGDC